MLKGSLRTQARAFRAKKRLGQNFLVSPDALTQIVQQLKITEGDYILEIGPGLGFLTAVLVGAGAHVKAVELDGECVEVLKNLSLPRLAVIHDDFLKCELSTIFNDKFKVVGNIPYQITSPIVARLLG